MQDFVGRCPSCNKSVTSVASACSSCGASLRQRAADRSSTVPIGFTLGEPTTSVAAPRSVAPVESSAVSGAAAAPPSQVRLQVAGMVAEGPDGTYTAQQVQELLLVIESSQQHGKEIEQAVVQLAELLRNKTAECEGLRSLASDTYGPLRHAVRQEYDLRLKAESRHALETRKVTMANEELRGENFELRTELAHVRRQLEELRQVPKQLDFNKDSQSVFARMMRDGLPEPSPAESTPALHRLMAAEATTPALRDFLGFMARMGVPHARAFHERQWFSVLKVLVLRLCSGESVVSATPTGPSTSIKYPELEVVMAGVVRDVRSSSAAAIEMEASRPIPTASRTPKEMVSDLYLANNPQKQRECDQLLLRFAGREEELYLQLKRAYGAPVFDDFDADNENVAVSSDGSGEGPRSMRSLSMSALAASRLKAMGSPRSSVMMGSAAAGGQPKLSPTELKEMHARCVIMYKKYNPAKANSRDFSEMLKKYTPDVLLRALVEKYGPEPSAEERREIIRQLMMDASPTL
jgi:hypothetical protein